MPLWFVWFTKSLYPITAYLVLVFLIAKFAAGPHLRLKCYILSAGLAGALIVPLVLPWTPSFRTTEKVTNLEPLAAQGLILQQNSQESTKSQNEFAIEVSLGHTINWSRYAFVAWVYICGVFMGYNLFGYTYFVFFWGARQVKASGEICRKFQELARDMKIRCPVELKLTRGNIEPSTFGFFRPCVILPLRISEQFSWEKIRPILVHELSHIKRRDLLIILLQRIAESVFFFHPLVWWMSQSLSHSLEVSCDQQVVRREKDGLKYARSIVGFLEFKMKPTYPMRWFSVSYFGSLKDRIRQIVAGKVAGEATFARKAAAAILAGLVFTGCLLTWSENEIYAQTNPPLVRAISSNADLALKGPQQIVLYQKATYTILVADHVGSTKAICRLPENMEYLSSSPLATFQKDSRELSWVYPGSTEMQITVRGIHIGNASIEAHAGHSRAIIASRVVGIPALHINSYDTEDPIMLGEETTYVIEARNEGTASASDIELLNTIPRETVLVNAAGPSDYHYQDGVVHFDPAPPLQPGEKLTYKIKVKAMRTGSAVNSAKFHNEQFGELCSQEGTSIFD